ncbi:response regulator transcription factor [Rhizobium sullae]|uniref:DNA-binding NarL/FixJ family response regulator n=1 Tax=Rhizobium sullae TaxID=50338 RepID=A0A4R3PRJ0_RHISU|nr:response regulator transcription factor [Rhizobium sullae]TCU06822.1 DNA-binding NarL/FixJ family response regulator [Rhizobium sullae]
MVKEILQAPFDVDRSTFLLVSDESSASAHTLTSLMDRFRDVEMLKADSAENLPRASDIFASKLVVIIDLMSIDNVDLAISHLDQEFPAARIAAIFERDQEDSYQEAILLKARYGRPHGFIPASASPETLAAVLHIVADGGEIMPWTKMENANSIRFSGDRGIRACGTAEISPPQYAPRTVNGDSGLNIDVGSNPLTQREQEVLRLLTTGMQNKIIANRMGISENTIRIHIHHILRKLGVRNRTEAANAGLRSGLLSVLLLECRWVALKIAEPTEIILNQII